MPKLKKLFTIFSLSLLASNLFAQKKIISGFVKDYHSEEPIPFASVYFKGTQTGKLSDSSGHFSFLLSKWPADTLEITCVGYQPFRLYINPAKDSIQADIKLDRGTFNEEVTVRVKVNKGLYLWRKIVANKEKNDRYRFANFSYELYNKLEVDLKNVNFHGLAKIKPLRPVTNLINSNIDSTEMPPVLPAYLTETLSDYYFQKKPKKRREVIKAANLIGVENESIVKFLGGMEQNIDVYDNFIPVFEKPFVSPISDNGDAYYNYRVTDTQVVANRKFFRFVFTPKHHGENSFEGDCWVDAKTFAIQKMNLRLGKDANVNFLETLSLIQEYKLVYDSIWFLSKDKFVADLSPFGKESPAFVGRKTTTYKNVVINDSSVVKELAKNKLTEETITLPDATKKDNDFWIASRHDTLNKNERAIIKMIDTLMNAPQFKRFTRILDFIGTGYWSIGNYQIGPWYNWYSYDGWEGSRVRFDIGTNHKFNKKITFHSYLAYGFLDKKFKGEADAFWLMKKHPRLYLYGSYTNDLDFGQNYYGEVSSDNIFGVAIRKPNVQRKYISVEEKRFEFFRESNSGFSVLATGVHKAWTPLKNLLLKNNFSVAKGDPLTTFEVGVRLRFAYLEKFVENNFYRTSLGSPYPIPEVYFTKGISGFLKSAYNYTKLSASIHDYFKIPPYGNIYFNVFGGKTFGTLPYMMLDIQPGNELYYYNQYAFNMMNKYEYVTDKYVGVNIEHHIGNGIFRLVPKLKFRQFWTAKAVWGNVSDANYVLNFKQGTTFQTLNGRTYLELGTGIDNILHVLRLDFIWRLLPTPLPSTVSKKFGVFGSFRLSF